MYNENNLYSLLEHLKIINNKIYNFDYQLRENV